ncbi:peptide-N4-(N-acetyl-beta-glucosaminyl)asparagine amidase [Lachancea thermotolerans CBS 6340]|uniref:Peptide-N(4)-(N-acetyl-beta-glucosaminyl)asparagine amidase n=1 Tax=Lachancea thermotolerans (strain ATCC 56472 / CBS 6340 / NRRL Y-8284) TaxID=559295 RepID=C5DIK9_LACTC|nr:KLTH0E13332p [Lachancea thermotolerans CBS 6340]CAR23620.1 KLTH0E13332p [Lachancea thermotolerans CBS 6340]
MACLAEYNKVNKVIKLNHQIQEYLNTKTMDRQLDFRQIAARFLDLYKQKVVRTTRNISDSQRFQSLIRSNEFARNIFSLSQNLCSRYENDIWQARVLDCIDLETIYSNVEAMQGSEDDYLDRLVKELLRYFKRDFFKWCDKPECSNCCDSEHQTVVGHQGPNAEERRFDCGVVETYKCQSCGSITRFPRYNDPVKLLETRKGRCGEWCNLFMLFLKAFGIESRYVWNREDHVWCEFYSTHLKRWVHVDSCEQSFDEPHIYSNNWGKHMSYAIAFGRGGCSEVSKRYIVKNQLPRDQISEDDLQFLLSFITKRLRMNLSDSEIYKLSCRDEQERLQLMKGDSTDRQATGSSSVPQGRQSGSASWKSTRGEDGKR